MKDFIIIGGTLVMTAVCIAAALVVNSVETSKPPTVDTYCLGEVRYAAPRGAALAPVIDKTGWPVVCHSQPTE